MENRTHRRRRKRVSPMRVALFILAGILFVVIVAGASALILWNRSAVLNQQKMFVPQQLTDIGAPTPQPSATPEPETAWVPDSYDLYWDGAYYRLRKNVVSVLFMGIDSAKNQATDSEIVSGTNQADTLLLGVFDTENGSVRVLHIPRDTEADVKVLDMTKKYVSTQRMHICLQHAYGDGGSLSCELTMDAVSNLLFGAPIYRYVSLGTKGAAKAVNAIGGVELEMLDDFSFYSKSMAKGNVVKLNGNRALVYIRARQDKGLDGTDQGRMKRQEQFLEAFMLTVKERSKQNPALALTVYEEIKDYLQTNLSLEELLFLANQAISSGFSKENLVSLPGTVGSEAQPLYHMDDEAARQLVLDLFYERIDNAA